MPCYHPIQAFQVIQKDGTRSRPFFAPNVKELSMLGKVVPCPLPCGRCLGCRLERSRQWALRCVNEASMHKENSFITLTYDDDHVPSDYSLKKRDFQLFMKRLRKHFAGKKIRFFACGEYGEHTFRPHYHAILFGHQFTDRKIITKETENGVVNLYQSKTLNNLWQNGFASSGEMTFESAAYVARYCLKKINGPEADYHYLGREPEFSLMSRMPGIGADWLKYYRKDVYPNDICMARGVPSKPPRYYDEQLKKIDEELYKLVKADRYPDYDPETYAQGEDAPMRLYEREKAVKTRQKKVSRGI